MITLNDVFNDLDDKLYNISCDDALIELSYIVYNDLEKGWCDYRKFILKDMDVHSFVELRNSFLLRGSVLVHFDTEKYHKNIPICNDLNKILGYRNKFIKSFMPDYNGELWKYYMLLSPVLQLGLGNNTEICFEEYCKDTCDNFDGLLGREYYLDFLR